MALFHKKVWNKAQLICLFFKVDSDIWQEKKSPDNHFIIIFKDEKKNQITFWVGSPKAYNKKDMNSMQKMSQFYHTLALTIYRISQQRGIFKEKKMQKNLNWLM